jgi:hypothetical protein
LPVVSQIRPLGHQIQREGLQEEEGKMGRLTRGSEGREERRERRSMPGGGAQATFTGAAVLRAGEREGEWCGRCRGWCCPYIG